MVQLHGHENINYSSLWEKKGDVNSNDCMQQQFVGVIQEIECLTL